MELLFFPFFPPASDGISGILLVSILLYFIPFYGNASTHPETPSSESKIDAEIVRSFH
jgi:hypothetical protein